MDKELIKNAEQLIYKGLQMSNNKKSPIVSCSFGKDSVLVLHLVRKFIDPLVIWCDTRVEYPDFYRFAEDLNLKWNLNIRRVTPKVSFWWIVEKYGWPLFGRGGDRKLEYRRATDACCTFLKKKPYREALMECGSEVVFDGLTASESRNRFLMFKNKGPVRRIKKDRNVLKVSPIWNWTEKDVWSYIRENEIPYCKFYDKKLPEHESGKVSLRNGCWCCTIPIRYYQIKHLRIFYPKLWYFLMIKKGFAQKMIELKGIDLKQSDLFFENLESFIEQRPCFFDRI